ncbi:MULTISPECIES: helix-turn-helix domain-containing protein [Mogibacterium]|uniref:Cro/C1-type HTH DNA-binding domain protein n=2 Tax=Mogibacterium timidum TaxID=35519 RepID=X8IU46_9FIRM|nr:MULTISPECIES: helix-turn-helix transcriptional regulator [Mogibacterium]EUC52719.1 Cro/C1-type HTH DNA-binding domain protein [Mogibacterium timidum ATCC 33093]NWO22679.1 helix-turn-helix domain-containing protein [Mogibacterium timidum]
MSIKINLDSVLASRNVTIRELSEAIDITPANISILKNNRARAIRFTTLDKMCNYLKCSPGDIIVYEKD